MAGNAGIFLRPASRGPEALTILQVARALNARKRHLARGIGPARHALPLRGISDTVRA
jgi:hypothetical protein